MIRDRVGGVAFLRGVLATVVVADLVSFFFFLGDARAIAVVEGIAFGRFTDCVSQVVVRGVIVCSGIAGAVAFGRRPGRLWAGMLSLTALILLSTAHAQLFGSPWRHLFFSGVCLLGWLLGLGVVRHWGAPTDESYARIGSVALLGATYLNGGISKIVYSGLSWAAGVPIQSVVVGQDGLVADSVLSVYRSWVVMTPAAASAFSVATLAFEMAAPLMIVGRKTRLCVAGGLLAMHVNIYILTDILYWEAMLLLVVFGLCGDGTGD